MENKAKTGRTLVAIDLYIKQQKAFEKAEVAQRKLNSAVAQLTPDETEVYVAETTKYDYGINLKEEAKMY